MIQSQFVKDILDLLFDGDEFGLSTRKQMDFLTESKYDYTGIGVFIHFIHTEGINQYRLNEDDVILGVKVKDDKNSIDGYAQVFTKNGIVDYLEIVNDIGDYPKKELDNYILIQEWKGAPGRTIVRNKG
ncbi:MAG: hypothetical protein KF900_03265 [Bacteroidetes bacterium]|nr:hypothetical protein [Bacteroidota bacterium]